MVGCPVGVDGIVVVSVDGLDAKGTVVVVAAGLDAENTVVAILADEVEVASVESVFGVDCTVVV